MCNKFYLQVKKMLCHLRKKCDEMDNVCMCECRVHKTMDQTFTGQRRHQVMVTVEQ